MCIAILIILMISILILILIIILIILIMKSIEFSISLQSSLAHPSPRGAVSTSSCIPKDSRSSSTSWWSEICDGDVAGKPWIQPFGN